MTDRSPLVTFALFAFNQERFIEEAVRGALAQTHERLQIILSDDCSTDRTFQIMQSIAEAYDGPHDVRLNKTTRNGGFAAHINDVIDLADGEIIAIAAGDDISKPERVARSVALFDDDTMAVFSGYTIIDPNSSPISDVVLPSDFSPYTELGAIASSGGWVGMGAAWLYRHECFVTPRKIPEEIICEDRLLPFRARVLGKIGVVSQPLVQYRVHDRSATATGSFRNAAYEATHRQVLLEELDWSLSRSLVSPASYERIKRKLNHYPRHLERSARLAQRPILGRLYSAFYHRATLAKRLRARLQKPFSSSRLNEVSSAI